MSHSCWLLSAPASLLCAEWHSQFFSTSVAPFPQLGREDAVSFGGCLLWELLAEHWAVLLEVLCDLLPVQAVPISQDPREGARGHCTAPSWGWLQGGRAL